MGVIFESGYATNDQPTTHARIAHASNWLSGTVTASTTDASFFADGPDNSLTYERWKPTALPATWELDFGASNAVDYCCIAAHKMGTNGNTLQIQRFNGGAWTDVIPSTAITDDMPIFAIFTPTSDAKYRIRITNGTVPEIGVIRFGLALQMTQPIYAGHEPSYLNRNVTLTSNISETGEFIGRSKVRGSLPASFAWSHLRADWVRTQFRPFVLAAETGAFFIAWRPATFSEVIYGQTQGPIRMNNMGIRDYMTADVKMIGRGYD